MEDFSDEDMDEVIEMGATVESNPFGNNVSPKNSAPKGKIV